MNTPTFAPVVIAPAAASPPSVAERAGDGVIEIAIGGNVVRVGKGVDAATLATVLAAVRRASS